MIKAIITKWECPGCGALIGKKQVFATNAAKTKYSFSAPTKCPCGRTKMNLFSFESATAIIKSDKLLEKLEEGQK